jgi:hypothetical protein
MSHRRLDALHAGLGFLDESPGDLAAGVNTRLGRHTALQTGVTVIPGLPGGTGVLSAGIVFRGALPIFERT